MSVLDLKGVSDPAERRRLTKYVNRYAIQTTNGTLALIVLCGTIASVLLVELTGTPSTLSQFWKTLAIVLPCLVATALVLHYFLRKHRRNAMIQLLRCELRCTTCGYALKGSPGELCPECGAKRPFSMTGRDAASADPE